MHYGDHIGRDVTVRAEELPANTSCVVEAASERECTRESGLSPTRGIPAAGELNGGFELGECRVEVVLFDQDHGERAVGPCEGRIDVDGGAQLAGAALVFAGEVTVAADVGADGEREWVELAGALQFTRA